MITSIRNQRDPTGAAVRSKIEISLCAVGLHFAKWQAYAVACCAIDSVVVSI